MARRDETSHEQWQRVRGPYRRYLAAVGEVQADMLRGAIRRGRWPYATEVGRRMGVSPSTVRRIVRDWDHFVDAALAEFSSDAE